MMEIQVKKNLILLIIIIDLAHLPHLEAIDRDGGCHKQALGAFDLGIVAIGRREQIHALQVIHAPVQEDESH